MGGLIAALKARLRLFAHRRGWIASPSLAFMGVPFGPNKRDLAGEIITEISRRHDPATCPLCTDTDAQGRVEPDLPPDQQAYVDGLRRETFGVCTTCQIPATDSQTHAHLHAAREENS